MDNFLRMALHRILHSLGSQPGFVFTFCALWLGVVVWISIGRLDLPTGQAAANWAPLFLGVTIILFGAQVYFQVLARHLEYMIFLLTMILFVQASTILVTVAIGLALHNPKIEGWVIPTLITSLLLLLVLLLAQVQTLRWIRDWIHLELERIIFDPSRSNLSCEQLRALAAAAKYIVPIDFSPESIFSMAAKYPEAWDDLLAVLNSSGVSVTPEDFETIRDSASPQLRAAKASYWRFGLAAAVIGSLTVVLGGASIG